MGQNLALNIADHGFKISVFNRTFEKTAKFLEANGNVKNLSGCEDIKGFVASLQKPRKIVIMVQAGKATDAVIDSLIPTIVSRCTMKLYNLTLESSSKDF